MSCALTLQVLQSLLGHLSRADDQRPFVVKMLEDPPRKTGDSDPGDADAVLVNGRFAGDAASDPGGGLECCVCQRSSTLLLGGELIGQFHLGGDLRFAHHHTVQTAGHQKQVAYRLSTSQVINVLDHFRRFQSMEARQKVRQFTARRGTTVL